MVLLKRRPAHSFTSSAVSKCGVAPRDWLQMVGYSGLPPPSVRARVDGLCPLLVRCDLVKVWSHSPSRRQSCRSGKLVLQLCPRAADLGLFQPHAHDLEPCSVMRMGGMLVSRPGALLWYETRLSLASLA